MDKVIKGVVVMGLLVVSVILGQKIYELRESSMPLSFKKEAGRLLDIIGQKGVSEKERHEAATVKEAQVNARKDGNQTLLPQKKLNSKGPFLDKEDRAITKLATGEAQKAHPTGTALISEAKAADPSRVEKVINLEDGRVDKIEDFYSKATAVLEGIGGN